MHLCHRLSVHVCICPPFTCVIGQVCNVQLHSSAVSGAEGQPLAVTASGRVIRSEVLTVAAVNDRFRVLTSPAREAAAAAYKYRVKVSRNLCRSERPHSRVNHCFHVSSESIVGESAPLLWPSALLSGRFRRLLYSAVISEHLCNLQRYRPAYARLRAPHVIVLRYRPASVENL